ncbi:MAG: formate dehydrogenase accessory sulfurtransferase FdhD [Candidatus Aminicenantes bacterium]|nr:formate dehydrogenase accessory sulfurtransferase FdhD [Candidatus Aminicenantes bacterium]
MKKEITIKAFKNGVSKEKKDFVVIEKNMEIILNEKTRISLAISPADLREFTFGFLFSSGFISSEKDVKELHIDDDKIEVSLEQKKDLGEILSLGSSGGRHIESGQDGEESPFREKLVPDADKLLSLFAEFADRSVVFTETGGVHSAAVCDGETIKFFAEDIGRHNAVDKVIGSALLAKIDFAAHFLLLSGRISSEMVKKAFAAGLPTIVSRAAPTSLALEKARRHNMTIIGFLRGSRFNLYT